MATKRKSHKTKDPVRFEYPDPKPMEVHIDNAPQDLQAIVKALVKDEVSKNADKQGFETFEEADDFEVEDPDEADFVSHYEFDEMPLDEYVAMHQTEKKTETIPEIDLEQSGDPKKEITEPADQPTA